MIITPIIDSNVARSCHPLGCHEMIKQQVKTIKNSLGASRNKQNVLILGASSGFGLAARICLTFGGGQANTLGVSYERGPSDKSIGTAGWYNNIYFKQEAERHGYQAINIVGDAFAKSTRQQVAEAIQQKFNNSEQYDIAPSKDHNEEITLICQYLIGNICRHFDYYIQII